MIGIYKITSPTNRIYIGSSVNLKRRFREYKYLYNSVGQIKLHRSFLKHGVEAHKFDIICECSLEELYQKECYYGEIFDSLGKNNLNLSLPHSLTYGGHSEETKRKISKGNTGKVFSEESRLKMSLSKGDVSGDKNYFYGKKHTEELKNYLSSSRKNGGNPNAKKLLDTSTNIIYNSIIEASIAIGVHKGHIARMLRGERRNTTSLIYLKDASDPEYVSKLKKIIRDERKNN